MDTEKSSTASDAKLPIANKSPLAQGSDFFRHRNEHIDQIYLYLMQAQQESCIASCSEDNVEDTYNGVDREPIHLAEDIASILTTLTVGCYLKDCIPPDGEVAINTSTRKLLKAMETDLHERTEIFEELIKRVERLERHIIQRVDIIQEDHGKATLIFTIVATIFLPLSFVSSYLGMNTADIRNMDAKQILFWEVATPFTVVVVSVVLLVAYNARRILGWLSQAQL
ncbi:hypothetical protein N7540_002386 [Penicillium herquei]|nr:hypothetical protein N7540_002386 [Penicillium herquei]